MESTAKPYVPFWVSLISGGAAGMTVDLCLYPLDTIKTRMQAPGGFFNSGGFKGIYRGIGAVAIGSVPGAGLFFVSYDSCKYLFTSMSASYNGVPDSAIHMLAASVGEVIACLIRVPTELIKQRMQAGQHSSLTGALAAAYSETGGIAGFYRGYGTTILREIPFAFIQFPIYEKLKVVVEEYSGRPPMTHESALCGSVGGAIGAALTTPLDVLKTRIMLSTSKNGVLEMGVLSGLKSLYAEGGVRVLFSGVQPRVMWISIGGFVFFGAYEKVKTLLLEK